MCSLQVTAFRPCLSVRKQYNTFHGPDMHFISPFNLFDLQKSSLKRTISSSKKCSIFVEHYMGQRTGASLYQRCTPVCLFGGKGKSENGSEASPLKSLEKAMSSFKKEQSLEDVLRKQMEKKEYYDEGGSGGKPPSGGGGGGGGGGSGEFGGTEDDGVWDEILQVTMATLAFIALYCYIVWGDEIKSFLSDCHDYYYRGRRNERIKELLVRFGAFYRRLKSKPDCDPYWLEKAIICTPTWWDNPYKFLETHAEEFKELLDEADIFDSDSDSDEEVAGSDTAAAAASNGKTDSDNAFNDNADDDNSYKDDDFNDDFYDDDAKPDFKPNVKTSSYEAEDDTVGGEEGDDEYF